MKPHCCLVKNRFNVTYNRSWPDCTSLPPPSFSNSAGGNAVKPHYKKVTPDTEVASLYPIFVISICTLHSNSGMTTLVYCILFLFIQGLTVASKGWESLASALSCLMAFSLQKKKQEGKPCASVLFLLATVQLLNSTTNLFMCNSFARPVKWQCSTVATAWCIVILETMLLAYCNVLTCLCRSGTCCSQAEMH